MRKLYPKIFFLITSIFTLNYSNLEGSTSSKIEETIDHIADKIKQGVGEAENAYESIQDYLDHYHWNGVIHDSISEGPITLRDIRFNGHKHAAIVEPGSLIEGELSYILNEDKANSTDLYSAQIGFTNEEEPVSLSKLSKLLNTEKIEHFTIRAPSKPGLYQLKFRPISLFPDEEETFSGWLDNDGVEPSSTSTIGLIIVK